MATMTTVDERRAITMSNAMGELLNLRQAADEHARDCHREDCGVTLTLLAATATRLLSYVWTSEAAIARRVLDGWPL